MKLLVILHRTTGHPAWFLPFLYTVLSIPTVALLLIRNGSTASGSTALSL
jgi:hypothetical protein